MNNKLLKRSLAFFAFLIPLITYYMTAQPSVSFWDCGEYLATSYGMEIPHPPGAPLFLILARFFSILPIASNIAFRMNLISIFTSALAVMLLYYVIIKVIESYRGNNYKNTFDALTVYLTAFIAALAHAFAYITWFNAVETEVYATNTFVFAAILLLLLIWNERADQTDSEKYILLIAYLVGLSTSLRLMGALTTISIVMLIMFRKYVNDDKELKKTVYYLLVHVGVLLIIGAVLWISSSNAVPPSRDEYKAFDTKFMAIMVVVSLFFIGIFWKKLFHRNSIYLIFLVGAVTLVLIYPGMVRILPGLIAQVGGTNNFAAASIIIVIFLVLGYGIFFTEKNNKPTVNLTLKAVLVLLLGFTSYGVIIIRSNLTPPINENAPSDFNQLVTYLNREQYGEWPMFQRRYSPEANQQDLYKRYPNDMDFLWNYQMNHMMTRYILWNFSGRESWDQDAGPNIWPFNGVANIIGKAFGLNFSGEASKSYFGIPLLIGLLGLYFHFKKDWKMAAVFFVLFIMITYVTAYYQNQQEPQPRERIKFYGTMCFMFSIWIGIGIHGLIELIREKYREQSFSKGLVFGVFALAFIFIPARMYMANYHDSDRSKNWLPWDFAYNMLQSCAPNAVLFTGGDNDTFPLWYLQEVEGVRQDVRVACLSLINTPWYINQLKNESPHGAMKVDMTLSDMDIQNIQPMQWQPQNITLPVPQDVYKEFGITDTTVTNKGEITFRMNNTLTYGQVKAIRVQDIAVMSIVVANNWKRPIYFAATCGTDSKIGLTDYLSLEGLTSRLIPEKIPNDGVTINPDLLASNLLVDRSDYSKTYSPGFKYRNLNDSTVYYDDNMVHISQNYRILFMQLASTYLNENKNDKAIAALNEMQKKVPPSAIPMDYRYKFNLSNLYLSAGKNDIYKKLAGEIEKDALADIEKNPTDSYSYYSPYSILLRIYDNLNEYDKAVKILTKLSSYYPDDARIKSMIKNYEMMSKSKNADTTKQN